MLVRDANSTYVSVGYADNKDNKLIEILVALKDGVGFAEYKPWNISFQFSDDWQKVQVVKKHQSDVIDELKDEWCEFDSRTDISIGTNKTFDWYVANELIHLQRNSSTFDKVANIGSGVIYSGALELQTNGGK